MKLRCLPMRFAPAKAEGVLTPPRTERIRGTTLKNIREAHFAEHPLCVHCQAKGETRIAEDLDHITPLWAGGADEPHNRQGLCKPCHQIKTAEEAKLRC